MRHVEKALLNMDDSAVAKYITIKNADDVKGVAPVVSFELQSDPIGEVGVNGCQVGDILEFAKELYKSLNAAVPNRETSLTITNIEQAEHWQWQRTKDREKRGVEGTMNK